MKTLLILRHAKSSWNDSSLADHERPLNARGESEAPRIGRLLRDQQLIPDMIISSDAVRAKATAHAVAEAAECPGRIAVDRLLYLATPDDIIAVLNTTPPADARTVLIVGHNPGLEQLVAQLTGEPHDLGTATLAHLAIPINRWQDLEPSTRAALVDLTRAKDLE